MRQLVHRIPTVFSYGIFLLLAIVPLALGLGYALSYSLGWTGLLSEGFTLAHWSAVLFSGELWWSLALSLYAAVLAIGLAILLALGLVLRWKKHLLQGRLSYVIYLPLVFPATVVGFLLFQWLSKGGFFSRISFQLGWTESLQAFPSIVNDQWGVGIILAHMLMATPFFTILFANIYRSEQLDRLTATATTLGANQRQIQRKVVVPILLQRSRATLFLYGVFVMSSFEVPLLLGSQSPQMISVLTVRKLQRYNLADIPQAYTISVIYSVVVMLLLFIGFRWISNRKGRIYG